MITKWGVVILIVLFVCLASVSYGLNLNIDMYRETTEKGKDYGDIKAKPGDYIEAFIEIENENQDRNDESQEIEDIEVVLTIEGINDDNDIIEEYDDFDLNPKRKRSLPFSFKIPLRVSDKSYPIKVEIEASEDNKIDSKSEEFSLNVMKERHELHFVQLNFTPEKVSCNGISYIDIKLYNLGTENEDIVMSINNKELGFSVKRGFSLESYPYDDTYSQKIPFKVPADAESGRYPFEISLIYDNGRLFLNKLIEFEVDCTEKTEQESVSGKGGVSGDEGRTQITQIIETKGTPIAERKKQKQAGEDNRSVSKIGADNNAVKKEDYKDYALLILLGSLALMVIGVVISLVIAKRR